MVMHPIVTFRIYNAHGQRKYITYANGAHTTYHYDEKTFRLTRLITTRNTGADILQDLIYVYDAVGNIVEMTDDAQETIYFNNTQVTPDTKYVYDPLYRLLSATGRQMVGLSVPSHTDVGIQSLPDATTTALELYTQSYEYDEMGNMLEMAHAASSGNWTKYYYYTSGFTNNYLLSTDPTTTQPSTDHYTYDAHGNMTSMPHLASMGWDFAYRLQSADLGGGGDAYYAYDAGGNRVRKVIINGNITEERIYLGDWEIYRKTVSSVLTTERETLHISDDTARIARVDTLIIDGGSAVSTPAPVIRYQLSNHLGTATIELDTSAVVISYEEYHPFGTTSYRSENTSGAISLKRYRYVGKERDDETGLYYYGARYYAAWLARFVSVDPLKDDYPYYTSYQYAGNKPITFIDLDGLEEVKPKLLESDDNSRMEMRQKVQAFESFQKKPDFRKITEQRKTELFQKLTDNAEKLRRLDSAKFLDYSTAISNARHNLKLFEDRPLSEYSFVRYLEGEGGYDIYDINEIKGSSTFSTGLSQAMNKIRNLAKNYYFDNGSSEFTEYTARGQGGMSALFSDVGTALGSFSLKYNVQMEIVSTDEGELIKGRAYFTLADTYTWKEGRNALFGADHDYMILLKDIGAADFSIRSYFMVEFSLSANQYADIEFTDESDIKNADGNMSQYPEISGGAYYKLIEPLRYNHAKTNQ